MALVKRFEELDAWRQARMLTKDVYSATTSGEFARDFGLVDQLRRAAVSTMNNVAEGFDSGSRIEFRRFLRYAVRSASEVQSCFENGGWRLGAGGSGTEFSSSWAKRQLHDDCLYVALDQEYMDQAAFDALYQHSTSTRRLCLGLLRHLATSKDVPANPRTPALPHPSTPTPANPRTPAPPHPRTRKS